MQYDKSNYNLLYRIGRNYSVLLFLRLEIKKAIKAEGEMIDKVTVNTKHHRHFHNFKDHYIICHHIANDSVNRRDERLGIKYPARLCCVNCYREGFLTTPFLTIDPSWKARGYDNVMKIDHKRKAMIMAERALKCERATL